MQGNDPSPIDPVGGAGLFDVDPEQGGVSQNPQVAVTGDAQTLFAGRKNNERHLGWVSLHP